MSNLRTPNPAAVFLFAGFPQAAETMDRVSRPEAREIEALIYPSGRDRNGSAWTEDDDAWLIALWDSGASVIEIGHTMGRTAGAIRMRLPLARAEVTGR